MTLGVSRIPSLRSGKGNERGERGNEHGEERNEHGEERNEHGEERNEHGERGPSQRSPPPNLPPAQPAPNFPSEARDQFSCNGSPFGSRTLPVRMSTPSMIPQICPTPQVRTLTTSWATPSAG